MGFFDDVLEAHVGRFVTRIDFVEVEGMIFPLSSVGALLGVLTVVPSIPVSKAIG